MRYKVPPIQLLMDEYKVVIHLEPKIANTCKLKFLNLIYTRSTYLDGRLWARVILEFHQLIKNYFCCAN